VFTFRPAELQYPSGSHTHTHNTSALMIALNMWIKDQLLALVLLFY